MLAGFVFVILMLIGISVLLHVQKKRIRSFKKDEFFEKTDKSMKKLIVYQGIQGSGKSTAAKAFVMEDPNNRVRVNRDDIRLMLGKPFNPKVEGIVNEIEDAAIKAGMKNLKDVVSDNMNLNPKVLKYLEDLAFQYGYEIEYRFIYTPLEECIERDSKREHPVGEKVIRETYRRYEDYIEKHNPDVIVF